MSTFNCEQVKPLTFPLLPVKLGGQKWTHPVSAGVVWRQCYCLRSFTARRRGLTGREPELVVMATERSRDKQVSVDV